jgi:ribosomal protein S26
MKILVVNKYFYPKGGSERSMFKITALFESKGHEVAFFSMHDPHNETTSYDKYFVSNIDYGKKYSIGRAIHTAINVIYNKEANKKIEKIINVFKPDVIQSHNIYHQISLSIYSVAKKYGIPIFQFLHDYKVVCPVYNLLSNGKVCCGRCENNRYYWCTLKRCNGNSIGKSFINTLEM